MSNSLHTCDELPAMGKIVVISGPSGVGKSTLVHRVRDLIDVTFSVSATTRRPRKGEQEGVDYYFVKRDEFKKMIDDGQMLEWAQVFDNYYGTPLSPIKEALAIGRTVLLDIDVQGGIQVFARRPGAMFILITPPDEETLQKRLAGRGTESPESLATRLAKAKDELMRARASGAYKYEVVNDDLDKAVHEVVKLIEGA